MQQQNLQNFDLYLQIRQDLKAQEYENLSIMLTLIQMYGIPVYLDLYNLQVFEKIIYSDLNSEYLSTYYQILHLAKIKFQDIQEQKLESEVYYSKQLLQCESQIQERYPYIDLKNLSLEVQKNHYLNQSEIYFLNFYINSKQIVDQQLGKNQVQSLQNLQVENYSRLISQAESDENSKMFNRIMVENIQNYFDKMKQSATQQPSYSQNQQIQGNNDNYGDGTKNENISVDNDNNSNLKFSNIFDVYKNVTKNNDENQQKIINVSKLEQENVFEDIQNNENVQNGLENQNDNGDDEEEDDEEDEEEFLIQSKIQSRINRPEEERKMLEEVDKCQEILIKQISESQNNSQLREQQKRVCCRTYFVQGENLPLENEIIEYKNFQWPIQDHNYVIDKLQKLICGMLNSKGGTVLIGVHDCSFTVLGLNLSVNQQDDYKLFIQDQVLNNKSIGIFDPKISIIDNQIRMRFIPVMNQQKQWLQGKWILKLQIKPNQSQQVYTLHNQMQQDALKCFVRLDGLNRTLQGIQLKQFMYDKSNQFHSKSFQEIHECLTEPDYNGVKKCSLSNEYMNQKIKRSQNHKIMRNNNKQQAVYQNNNKRQQLKENYFVNPNESNKQQQNNRQNKISNNDLQKNNTLQTNKNKNINQQPQKENKVTKNIKDLLSMQKIIQTQENNTLENNQQKEGSKNKIKKGKKKANQNEKEMIIQSQNDLDLDINQTDFTHIYGDDKIYFIRLQKSLVVYGILIRKIEFLERVKQQVKDIDFDLQDGQGKDGQQYFKIQVKDEIQMIPLIEQLYKNKLGLQKFFESQKYKIGSNF